MVHGKAYAPVTLGDAKLAPSSPFCCSDFALSPPARMTTCQGAGPLKQPFTDLSRSVPIIGGQIQSWQHFTGR